MHSPPARLAFTLVAVALGVTAASLFARGMTTPGWVAVAVLVGLLGWGAGAARPQRPDGPPAAQPGAPRPATVPPDGHLRFTLVVEGLEPDRLAAVWADLCRPDRPPPDEFRLLFQNFTVLEGRRFRFRGGDPTATAGLLTTLLGTAAGVPVRTSLEPAAERTAPWS